MIKQVLYKLLLNVRYFKKIRYVINMCIAWLFYLFITNKDREIWLIGDEFDSFSNNVKSMYLYLVKVNDIHVYWICDRKNKSRLHEQGVYSTVVRGSVKNYYYAFLAKGAFLTHSDSDIAPRIYRWFKRDTVLIDLTHGNTGLKRMKSDYFSRIRCDIICSCSEFEQKLIVNAGGGKRVIVTGYARYDSLPVYTDRPEIKRIMLMPTWREWYMDGNRDFKKTEMYHAYDSLITQLENSSFDDGVKYEIVFIVHPQLANYFQFSGDEFSKKVKMITDTSDISHEVIACDLLITDYSSLLWDFIYMDKPVICYRFDNNTYQKYEGSYSIGVYEETLELLEACISYSIEQTIDIIRKYTRSNEIRLINKQDFFKYFDKNNASRIFEEAKKKLSDKMEISHN